MGWSCMLLGLGFQENNNSAPQWTLSHYFNGNLTYRINSSPIELIPHLQTKLPKSYKIGEVSLAQSWAVRVTSSALIGWLGHDGEDKIRFFILPRISAAPCSQWCLKSSS